MLSSISLFLFHVNPTNKWEGERKGSITPQWPHKYQYNIRATLRIRVEANGFHFQNSFSDKKKIIDRREEILQNN